MAISKENIEKTKRAIMQAQEEYAKMTPEERAVVDDPNYGLNFLLKYHWAEIEGRRKQKAEASQKKPETK